MDANNEQTLDNAHNGYQMYNYRLFPSPLSLPEDHRVPSIDDPSPMESLQPVFSRVPRHGARASTDTRGKSCYLAGHYELHSHKLPSAIIGPRCVTFLFQKAWGPLEKQNETTLLGAGRSAIVPRKRSLIGERVRAERFIKRMHSNALPVMGPSPVRPKPRYLPSLLSYINSH